LGGQQVACGDGGHHADSKDLSDGHACFAAAKSVMEALVGHVVGADILIVINTYFVGNYVWVAEIAGVGRGGGPRLAAEALRVDGKAIMACVAGGVEDEVGVAGGLAAPGVGGGAVGR